MVRIEDDDGVVVEAPGLQLAQEAAQFVIDLGDEAVIASPALANDFFIQLGGLADEALGAQIDRVIAGVYPVAL